MKSLHPAFRWAYRLSGWVDRRFTLAGKCVLLVALASAVLGLDSSRTAASWIFSLCAAILVVASAMSWRRRPVLAVRRELPRVARAGRPVRYVIELTADHLLRFPPLVLRDELQDRFPGKEAGSGDLPARVPRANAFDRRVGYLRWVAAVEWLRGASVAPVPLPPGAVSPARVIHEFTPVRRGRLRFTGMRVLLPDVLGLVNASVWIQAPESLLVLPAVFPVPALSIAGGRHREETDAARVWRAGDGGEFLQVREHRPGDALRLVHWPRSARAGRLIVRENGEARTARHALVLDACGADGDRVAFEAAVSAAASLVGSGRRGPVPMDTLFLEDRVIAASAGDAEGGGEALLRALAEVPASPARGFESLALAVRGRSHELAACVHVFLRLDDPRTALVRALSRAGVAQIVLLVTGQDDSPPPLGAVPVHRVRPGNLAEDLARMPGQCR